MDRRRFLATAAASGAAALGGRALAAAAPGGLQPAPAAPPAPKPADQPSPAPVALKRTLRKAVMIGMVGEGATIREKFAILRDCGFEGVEMDSPSSLPIDDIHAAAQATGLIVHGVVNSVHWKHHLNANAPESRAKGVDALRTCLREAKALGASSVLLVPGVVNADQGYQECWARSHEAIASVLDLARETGVKIAVENVWNGFLLSPLEAARYVDEFNDAGVAFHFDIGNVINFGWPEHWVRTLGRRIVKLHIKDFSRGKRDREGLWKGFDVELGEGDAGWPRVMAALDEIGYSTDPAGRWATAEVRGGDRARLQQISKQMDTLFAT